LRQTAIPNETPEEIQVITTRGIGECEGESFGAEIAKHIPQLRNRARFLTRDEEAAADLTQETLTRAWASRDSFAPGTNLARWLYTIMRNQFCTEARRAWRQVAWDQDSAERISSANDEQYWAMELEDLVRAMETLSRRQREALILVGFGGFSTEEASSVFHCQPTAMKSRISRARRAIHCALEGKISIKRKRTDTGLACDRLVEHLHELMGRDRPPGLMSI
jgi:RNA polymerase sigma-70 factor (ECF subfamily)